MIEAVIFDLDGVIVSTDEYHYKAWKRLADEEGIYFDKTINNRLRGVSRMESLTIILERAAREYTVEEKKALAERKNNYYKHSLSELTPKKILPGAIEVLKELRNRDIKVAIGSSSKNAPYIIERIGLTGFFDAVADGSQIINSKPDPEVFLLAARLLGVSAQSCAVIEDAEAGIEAAVAGGMRAIGVGDAAKCEKKYYGAEDLSGICIEKIIQ